MERGVDAGALTQHRPVIDGLVGREEELARVESFLASRVHVTTMVLEGQAGIGKTILWEAGVAAARGSGLRVLACRPVAAEAPLPYAALGDLLAPVLEETLSVLPPPQRQALEVALLLRQPGARPPDGRTIGVSLVTVLEVLAQSSDLLVQSTMRIGSIPPRPYRWSSRFAAWRATRSRS